MQKSITSSAYKMPMQIKQCYCHLCIEKHCSSRHNTDWAAAMNGYSKCPKTNKKKSETLENTIKSRVSENSSMPLAGLEPAWFPA